MRFFTLMLLCSSILAANEANIAFNYNDLNATQESSKFDRKYENFLQKYYLMEDE